MSEIPLISIVDDDALARDGIRDFVDSFMSAEHFLEDGMIAETASISRGHRTPRSQKLKTRLSSS
jgi:hypothetical protein